LAIVAVCLFTPGCWLYPGEFNRNTHGEYMSTMKGLRRINYFVDRHFFDYTWDDPYAFQLHTATH